MEFLLKFLSKFFSRVSCRLRRQAFTLIEILLVVIILGILTAMAVPSFSGRTDQARGIAARTDIEANLAVALDLYQLDTGRYPTTAQGLLALLEEPVAAPEPLNWSGPYLKRNKLPRDPWGQAYQYRNPGEKNTNGYDLFSYGPDGTESDDDVRNWE